MYRVFAKQKLVDVVGLWSRYSLLSGFCYLLINAAFSILQFPAHKQIGVLLLMMLWEWLFFVVFATMHGYIFGNINRLLLRNEARRYVFITVNVPMLIASMAILHACLDAVGLHWAGYGQIITISALFTAMHVHLLRKTLALC